MKEWHLRAEEQRTYIWLWDVRDPAKAGVPVYWLDGSRSPNGTPLSGPRGQTPRAFRRKARDGVVKLRFRGANALSERIIEVPLAVVPDDDSEHTRVFVTAPPVPGESSLPPDVESLRRQFQQAATAGDEDAAVRARQRLEAKAAEHGISFAFTESDETDDIIENPPGAVEVAPGIFLVDERLDEAELSGIQRRDKARIRLAEAERLVQTQRPWEAIDVLDEVIAETLDLPDPSSQQTARYALLNKANLLRRRQVHRFDEALAAYDVLLADADLHQADDGVVEGQARFGKAMAPAALRRYREAAASLDGFITWSNGARWDGVGRLRLTARTGRLAFHALGLREKRQA
jgi:hypothetical protein